MEYITNNGLVTRIYEVVINTDKLLNIIKELDTKCYHEIYKIEKVVARNKTEAIHNINNVTNSAGLKVNNIISISNGYKDLVDYEDSSYVYDCEVFSKESSKLVNILKKIIINYNSALNFKNQNNYLIDLLYEYNNSDELKHGDASILLFELYNNAKECITFNLISEKFHNNGQVKKYRLSRGK